MNAHFEKWYDTDDPVVSIIVPNFDRSDLTKECLDALWANTRGYFYEILVVDNGSSRTELQKLIDIKSGVQLISVPENIHFGQGCKIGAEHAKGQFLVFLNNDAFVTFDWLAPLIRLLVDYSDAGAVGPRLIYPDGRLQEAGAFIDEVGNSIQVGQDKLYHPGEEVETRIVDYCSAACLAMPAAVFSELGGFDPLFSPAYYEDVDLCFRIARTKRFVYYCPTSTVVHIQNATSAQVWKATELERIIDSNRRRFMTRWGDWLRARAKDYEPS